MPPAPAGGVSLFIPMESVSQALNCIEDEYGEDFQAYILPAGNTVLPFFSILG